MPLVEELIDVGETLGTPLARVSQGRDRFGPVEVLHMATPHTSVRRGCDGPGYELTVWHGEDIVAQGRTSDVRAIAATLLDRQADLPVQDLCRRHEYLNPVAPGENVDALWHLLTDHGEEYLRPLVTAVSTHPTLRSLRPWISHGTLHLHPHDRTFPVRYGVAFAPIGDGTFRLHVYDRPLGPPEPLGSVVVGAAAAAESW